MSNKLLIVESDPKVFEHWTNSDYGVGAQVEALGHDGHDIVLEQIASAADLLEVAKEVKSSEHLPARAIIFKGIEGTDLDQSPIGYHVGSQRIEQPSDYDEHEDPIWVWLGDCNRPLTPYARLIASRLVHKAVPDVRLWVSDEENVAPQDLFHYHDSTWKPTYGGFLARINRHAAATGQDFMSLVDGTGEVPYPKSFVGGRDLRSSWEGDGRQVQIEGTDINALIPSGIEPILTGIAGPPHLYKFGRPFEKWDLTKHLSLAARLIMGEYPGVSAQDKELILPRKEVAAS